MRTLKAAVLAIAGLGLVAMAGCQTPRPPAQLVMPVSVDQIEGYRLGTGDEVKITVFDEPSMSGVKIVDGQGAITIDVLGGAIPVKNMTLKEVQTNLETRLKDGYLNNPRVTAELAKGRPFYVMGEINKPGEYPFTAGLTVSNAITSAGDFTYRADKRKVMITSADTGIEKEVLLTPTTPVRPGDRIRIRERIF